jgi:hypothetical protein
MSTEKEPGPEPAMRDEYDFSGGLRGKYAGRFAEGSTVIVLDPEVAGPDFHSRAPRGPVAFGAMTTPRMPPRDRSAGPPDVLRSEKGRRVIRRFRGSRVYRDLVRGERDPMEVEDSLAEELQARVARLRKAAASGPVDEAQVATLHEGAEVLREIVEGRNALVAMMDTLPEEGPHRSG